MNVQTFISGSIYTGRDIIDLTSQLEDMIYATADSGGVECWAQLDHDCDVDSVYLEMEIDGELSQVQDFWNTIKQKWARVLRNSEVCNPYEPEWINGECVNIWLPSDQLACQSSVIATLDKDFNNTRMKVKYEYNFLKQSKVSIHQDLIEELFQPGRIQKWIEYGNDPEDYLT